MRTFRLLLCLAMAASAAAQENVLATDMGRATMSEMAAVPLRENTPRVYRHRLLPPLRIGLAAGAASVGRRAVASATIAAPPVTTIFDADASRTFVPADSAGAVGPAHVLSTNNARVLVHDRSGKLLRSVTQDQFWASSLPQGEYYDPRAEYDPEAGRWILMAINDERAVAFAVSESSDPTGGWRRYRVEESYADFSMMGITRDTVVFSTITSEVGTSLLLSVRKSDLYSGSSPMPVTKHRFISTFIHPVTTTSTAQYVIDARETGLDIRDLNRSSWRLVARQPAAWDWALFRLLPQLGGSALDGGYGVLDDVAERNGWIYAVMVRETAGPGSDALVWCRVNVETGESEWGEIAPPDAKTAYAYPSLAVNRHGGMLIAFGIFSDGRYASSAYVYRDFHGRMSEVTPLRAGTGAVLVSERWGDYTTTVVDPVDQLSFWTAQIHAHDWSWATSWARIEVGQGKRRAARH